MVFESTQINGMALKNRLVRSATWEGLAGPDGAVTPALVRTMARLAAGGVGLAVTGHAYVRPEGKHSPRQLGIDHDGLIPGLKQLTTAVHENGGKIAVQLGYGGAYLSASRLRGLSAEHMAVIVEGFSKAAKRAEAAGFDAVEILAAHGFLLSQCLCPRYNPRIDEFGGSIQNRSRLLVRVTRAVRSAVDGVFPVMVKLNASDGIPDGLQPADALTAARLLESAGMDAIEISGGLLNRPDLLKAPSGDDGGAYFERHAAAFKAHLPVPVILVGGIRRYETARRILVEKKADFVAMSRPFICEPEIVARWQSGDRRPSACMSCNNCVEGIKSDDGFSCRPLAKQVQTFFPQTIETVPAPLPHPAGTVYRISFGLQQWDTHLGPAVKVEMIGPHGQVSAPVFSGTGSAFDSVCETIRKMTT